MIFQDLLSYYNMKREEGSDFPDRFWAMANVGWEFRLDSEGRLVSVVSLADDKGRPRRMIVPEQPTATSGLKAFFLSGKAMYILGRSERGQEALQLYRDKHHQILDGVDSPPARALLTFLDSQAGVTDCIDDDKAKALDAGANIVFRYLPMGCYVHEDQTIKQAWAVFREAEDAVAEIAQCSITGKTAPLETLFPMLRGVPGAQPSGASFVTYNFESLCSYGKTCNDQARNASISKEAASGIGAALNYLVSSPKHHIKISDGTYVLFWADAADDDCCNLFTELFDCNSVLVSYKEDELQVERIKANLKAIRDGLPVNTLDNVEQSTKFYVLGISPNMARLAVRFYNVWTLGDLQNHLGQFLRDIELVGRDRESSIKSYVSLIAPRDDTKRVPETLMHATVMAILDGTTLPPALYHQLLLRLRVEKPEKDKWWQTAMRVSLLKGCMIRRARQLGDTETERSITVALNTENTNEGYLLGRLFAVLEKAQADAVPGANATIRDRYIGAASVTPARVFPLLLKMAQHHIAKSNYGAVTERRLEEIISQMDASKGFAKTLSYDDQGQFFLGYYQQREAFYLKATDNDGMTVLPVASE